MKRAYIRPAMQVVKTQQMHIVCESYRDVMKQGEDNVAAGSRQSGGWDGEE